VRRAVLLIGVAVLIGAAAGSLARRGPPLAEAQGERGSLQPSASLLEPARGEAPVQAAPRSLVPLPAARATAGEPYPAAADDYGLPSELRRKLEIYRSAQEPGRREDALLDLALSDEPGVLPLLLDELLSASPSARPAAIDALVQYGSRDAIPALRRLAGRVATAQERAALLEAADYLALPSYTELRRGLWKPGQPAPH
jgi:hypothetical protein